MSKRRKVETNKEAEEIQKLQKNEWTDLCAECFHAILSHRTDLVQMFQFAHHAGDEEEWVSEATWMELWNSETQKLWKTLAQQTPEKKFIYVQFMSHLISRESSIQQQQQQQRLPLRLVNKLLTYMGKQSATEKGGCRTWSDIIEAEMKSTEASKHDADNNDLEKQEMKEFEAISGGETDSPEDQPLKCAERECGWTLEKFGLQIRSADEGYTYFWVCKNPRCEKVGTVAHRVN